MAILQTVAFVIYVIAAVLMILAILLQEGKGGGLAGLGGAQAEATFGATNPLRRFTVVMAVVFLFLAAFLDYISKGKTYGPRENEKPGIGGPVEPGESSKNNASSETPPPDKADGPSDGESSVADPDNTVPADNADAAPPAEPAPPAGTDAVETVHADDAETPAEE
ncbi:MAG: preprotein translocase subunit SecG [Planctomycetes bacterium]|nr:preprotein translocase subunit SecG [Planctomycetota bacterium]